MVFEAMKKEYESVESIVERFVSSDETNKHLTANGHKELLSQAFISLDKI